MRQHPTSPQRPADESPAVAKAEGTVRLGRFSRPKALPAHLAALLRARRKTPGALLPFDDPRVDGCLGGGLPLGQLHEIGAAGLDAETAALPTGFIAALLARIAPPGRCSGSLPRATCIRPACCPMASIPTGWCWCVRPRMSRRSPPWRWRCGRVSPAAVVGEVGQFDRTASRRLAACLPAPRLHRLRAASLAAWSQDRRPGGQRCRHPLASHAGAQREGRQGTGAAALARGVDACPRWPAGGMDHGGFG